MSRLTPVSPATASGRVKDIFEGPLKGKTFNIFQAMANSPAALDVYLGMAGALGHASLSAKEREVIQLVMAQANDCGYCAAAHTAIGMQSGLSSEQTLEARRGTMMDTKLNALAKLVTRINETKGFISNDELKAFKAAGYHDGSVAEVVATMALAWYTNVFNHVNDTPVDFPPAPKL